MNSNSLSSADYTRRDFVSLMTTAGAALPLSVLASRAKAAEPAAAKPPAAASPTCIHAFAKPLQWLSYDAVAELYAETGYGGIDFAVRPGGHVLPEKVEDDLPRAVEAARKAGLKVDMITTAILDARDKHTEPILKTAARLGVKYYRLGSLGYDDKRNPWETLQQFKPALKGLAEINQHYGLHGAYQNHVGVRVGGPVLDLYELLRELDPRWIGAQYDIRHATAEGGSAWPVALRMLAPWIKCTDFKDFKWIQSVGKASPESVPAGEGVVNFDQYFKMVRDLKVTGPISIHFEYPPFERAPAMPEVEKRRACAAAMRKDVQVLKGFLAKYQIA